MNVDNLKSIPIGEYGIDAQTVKDMLRTFILDCKRHVKIRTAAAIYLNELNGVVLDSDKCGPVLFNFYYGSC